MLMQVLGCWENKCIACCKCSSVFSGGANSVQIRTGCGCEHLVNHAWCYSVSRTVLLFVIFSLPTRTLSPTFVKITVDNLWVWYLYKIFLDKLFCIPNNSKITKAQEFIFWHSIIIGKFVGIFCFQWRRMSSSSETRCWSTLRNYPIFFLTL
jgi:hypothetical protein